MSDDLLERRARGRRLYSGGAPFSWWQTVLGATRGLSPRCGSQANQGGAPVAALRRRVRERLDQRVGLEQTANALALHADALAMSVALIDDPARAVENIFVSPVRLTWAAT